MDHKLTLDVKWIVKHIEVFIIVMILYFYPGFKHDTLLKTGQKMDFTGVEIAWVDMKSNEYPLFYT